MLVMPQIMLVDDDEGTLTLVGVMLEQGGFSVVRANSGSEALARLEGETPDLFIVDVMMPGMDGIELCRRIRSRPQTEMTPVVVLTAHGSPELAQAAKDVGADAYLNKPILWRDLLSKVIGLLAVAEKEPVG